MPNMSLPPEERNLTPAQVAALDHRRRRGSLLLVIAGQFAVIGTLLLAWVVQDLTYSPGFSRPIAYYFLVAWTIVGVAGLSGLYLRRGTPEVQ
jgi:hypothetical protein